MNNIIKIIVIFIFLANCSLNKNSKFWTNEKIVEEKQQNIKEILSVNNVDGVLVGGASLKIKDFLAIYVSAVKHLEKKDI